MNSDGDKREERQTAHNTHGDPDTNPAADTASGGPPEGTSGSDGESNDDGDAAHEG